MTAVVAMAAATAQDDYAAAVLLARATVTATAFSLLYSLDTCSTRSVVLGMFHLGHVLGGIGMSLLFSTS